MNGLRWHQAARKRLLDLVISLLVLLALGWIVLIAAVVMRIDTGEPGFFTQVRIGRNGRRFRIVKLRTMRSTGPASTTVTTADDQRITRLGRILRRWKIDELPQLANVVLGHMSIVGPRPDVPGFADTLVGEQRIVLTVRPGVTGPATLKYRDEETMLASQADPERFNREVIYPDKVRLNINYVRNWTFTKDLAYIWKTVCSAA